MSRNDILQRLELEQLQLWSLVTNLTDSADAVSQ